MTKREVAILACRILAIFAVMQAVGFLSISFLQFSYSFEYGSILDWIALAVLLSGPVMLILIAVYLWKRAGVVGALIFGHTLQDEPDEPDLVIVNASLPEVQITVLASIGIWLIVEATAGGTGLAARFLILAADSSSRNSGDIGWTLQYGSSLAEVIVRFLLGIWLVFGSRRIVNWLRRALDVGLERSDQPGPTEPEDGDRLTP